MIYRIYKNIKKYIGGSGKRKILKNRIKPDEVDIDNFLNFSKNVFSICEDEFNELERRITDFVSISSDPERRQYAVNVAQRDIIKTKKNIRARITSDLSELYDVLIKSNEQNNRTISVHGNGADQQSENKRLESGRGSGEPTADHNTEKQ